MGQTIKERAYVECENIIRENSKTFYKAFSILPTEKKKAVWAVYAFCRTVDDIVDEGENSNTEFKLNQFEQEFKGFLAGNTQVNHFIWIALSDVFKRYHMDSKPFFEMIEGQRMDLRKSSYDSEDEVLRYSYHVASTVGLMLLPILAPGKEKILHESAVKLGLAMQLTNILRDIGEDYERGRIYIPNSLMKQFGYDEGDLKTHTINSSFISIWEELAKKAEKYYEESLKSIDEYPMNSRTPVKASAYLYKAILQSVRKNGYNVFGKKNYVSTAEKLSIISQL
ncbi:phytoene/squalene synthase family protein [Bacillus timonensis]|nr:phytoene/squalene synthase family protein [Bacillus timonensis]